MFMEEIMNYGELFEKAWRIIWKHKVLWIVWHSGWLLGEPGPGPSNGKRLGYWPGFELIWSESFNQLFPGLQNFFYNLERGFQDGSAWPAIIGCRHYRAGSVSSS
jgi:hypothetical protein